MDLVLADPLDPPQRLLLPLILRNDPLARPLEPDAVLFAQLVQQILAADAQLRLEAAGPVVDSRVDDLAVARARFGADGAVALDEERGCVVALGELARNGEADDAAAYDLTMIVSGPRFIVLFWIFFSRVIVSD